MKRMFEGVCVVMFIAVFAVSILVCIDGVERLFEPVVELEDVVEVVVVPGDTVWQLISKHNGEHIHIGAAVIEYRKMNNDTVDIYPGQLVKVPVFK